MQNQNAPMGKKQKIALALIVIALVALVIFLISTFFGGGSKENPAETAQAPETPSWVVIDNTDGLENLLLATQYGAVRQELSSYIQSKVGKDIYYAIIVGQPTVESSGDIIFSVKTKASDETFAVKIVRKSFDTIDFVVPSDNYTKTIKPYGGAKADTVPYNE